MATTITFTIADDVVASIDSYRKLLLVADASGNPVAKYATVEAYIQGMLNDVIIQPALDKFNTTAMATAKQTLTAAQVGYKAVIDAAAPVVVVAAP